MEHKSVELIMQHLDKMADKLGIGASEMFSWYTKQIWIDFYRQMVWIAIFVILTAVAYALCKKWTAEFKKSQKDKSDEEKKEDSDSMLAHEIAGVAFVVAGIITFVIVLVTLFCNIPELMNIEYHAFNDLLYRIKL